jgi:NitT/TauT family transport system substrate-binding protein
MTNRQLVMMEPFHSPFYAPALVAVHGGHFARAGFDVTARPATPAKSAADALLDGSADFAVSGIMRSLDLVDRGGPPIVHFAAVNDRNGFFLVSRVPRPHFAWTDLVGRTVLSFGGAPTPYQCILTVLREAGVDPAKVTFVHGLGVPEAAAAFTAGKGDFIECGPPVVDALVADGVGSLAASMGVATGPVPFSSLMATEARLRDDRADLVRLVRAFHGAQRWLAHASADEVASVLRPAFPAIEPPLLARIVARYRAQGTWPDDPRLDRRGYERLQDILFAGGFIKGRHAYERLIDTSIATEAIWGAEAAPQTPHAPGPE